MLVLVFFFSVKGSHSTQFNNNPRRLVLLVARVFLLGIGHCSNTGSPLPNFSYTTEICALKAKIQHVKAKYYMLNNLICIMHLAQKFMST